MPGRRAVLVVALAALAAAAGGCGSDEQTVRIGVLTDCQGPLRGFEDAQLSGAELPFLRRGARLVGHGPRAAGSRRSRWAAGRVELVRGCQETGEHTVYIEEARRLLETEQVDAIVGGASVVARDLARRYPDVPFVSTFWDEQEVTLAAARRRTSSASRPITPSRRRASGRTHTASSAGAGRPSSPATSRPGWAGSGGVHRRVLRARWDRSSRRRTARSSPAGPTSSPRALAAKPDGVAAFLNFLDDPATILGAAGNRARRPATPAGLWALSLEDPALLQSARRQARRRRRHDVAARRRRRRPSCATTARRYTRRVSRACPRSSATSRG